MCVFVRIKQKPEREAQTPALFSPMHSRPITVQSGCERQNIDVGKLQRPFHTNLPLSSDVVKV